MSNRIFTVLVVPERSSQVRRYKIQERTLKRVAAGAAVAFVFLGVLAVNYVHIATQSSQNGVLKDENIMLRARLRLVQEEIARIDNTLQRIDRFATKIRAITQLNDPQRNLAMGPVSADADLRAREVLFASGERTEFADELLDSNVAMRLVDSQLDATSTGALQQEQGLRDLAEFFQADSALLATTPSIRPVGSRLLTSGFGPRTDPYTNHEVMHKGADFAADYGSEILAPADGLVIFSGTRGGYGKTLVVDHGFGVQTHYAHLSRFVAEVGAYVRRGQLLAHVGNTGRSTGSHLHYEVRFNGIPQDPLRFVLTD